MFNMQHEGPKIFGGQTTAANHLEPMRLILNNLELD